MNEVRSTADSEHKRIGGQARPEQEVSPANGGAWGEWRRNDRKCLFVNPGFTRYIEGLTHKESTALLELFHEHCPHDEYQVRWHWQPHTIAMWDNQCTQHRVVADNLDALRMMERITLQGPTPS